MSEVPSKEPALDHSQMPRSKHWRQRVGKPTKKIWWLITIVATLLGLAAGVIAIWQVWPRPGPGITFTNPPADAVTSESCVFTVTGRGNPPTGQDLVLSTQQQGTGSNVDPTMYFARATISADTWHVVVQIGNNSTPGGTLFTLTPWLVNAEWIKYLTQVTPSQRQWWATLGTPPGATMTKPVTVTRTAGKC